MNGKFLPDTNIVIALFANEPAVQERVNQAQEIFVAATVLGELYFGAQKSTRVEANLKKIEEFADYNTIVDCDRQTARQYGTS